jgi:glycosyltransferase involved in cell wall biosynthesis
VTRVCHFSSAHRGLDVRIFTKECVSLAEAGYETHLVIHASDRDIAVAADRGVTLHALPPSKGRLGRMVMQAWRCYRIARGLDADIYHFHDPELMPYGMLLAVSGKKVVYDVHEDLPRDIETKDWIPQWLRKIAAGLFGGLEHIGAKRFFSVVTATPHIEKRFRKVNPTALAINNYPLTAELAPIPGIRNRLRQICYVGGISRIRGIGPLIEALPHVADVRLVLCGEFSEPDFEAEVRALPGWRQVDYRGQVARSGLQQILGESLAGVVTFLPLPNHVDAQPNKMFEYMSAELPVIASDFPLWRDIIDRSGSGLCVNPESPVDIAATIRRLADDPALVERLGKAGRDAVMSMYNWPCEAEKLTNFYGKLK